jgi:hypothetical protein
MPTVPGTPVSSQPGRAAAEASTVLVRPTAVSPASTEQRILARGVPGAFPCSRERSGRRISLNGSFISDKRPIINTVWRGLMLMSDAECGSALSSDVCVAFFQTAIRR